MICAYCGREARGTREHIISSGVLGLFPECFATIDPERDAVYENDPMVRDVCADCNNNRISYIDTYAKYSLQGTTQGRYLTGGVPPVRFSM